MYNLYLKNKNTLKIYFINKIKVLVRESKLFKTKKKNI